MHALRALSQGAPAERGCAEEMCHRRRTRPQDGRRRVPTRGKKWFTMLGEEDGEDALRRAQSTAEGGASGCAEPWAPSPRWRAGDGEPKATHVPLWVAPGEPGGGTQGHGPHQGAKSAYNAPRGRGPGTLKIFAAPPPRAYIILVHRGGWNLEPVIRARVPIWNPSLEAGSKCGTRLLWRVPHVEPAIGHSP